MRKLTSADLEELIDSELIYCAELLLKNGYSVFEARKTIRERLGVSV